MNEQHSPEFFGLGPDRVQFGIREFLSGDAAADRGAAQPLFFHRGFELLDGEIGELQRQRGESGEPVGFRRAEFGELFVLYPDDLGGQVAILAIPEWGLIDSTSMSTPCASIALSRSSSVAVMKACLPASFIGDWKAAVSSPINFSAS